MLEKYDFIVGGLSGCELALGLGWTGSADKPCRLWSWVSPALCRLEPIRRGQSKNKLMATESVSLGLILARQEKATGGYQLKPLRGHMELNRLARSFCCPVQGARFEHTGIYVNFSKTGVQV